MPSRSLAKLLKAVKSTRADAQRGKKTLGRIKPPPINLLVVVARAGADLVITQPNNKQTNRSFA